MTKKIDYNVTENKEEWDRLRAKYGAVRLERPPGDGWFSLSEMLKGTQDDARKSGVKSLSRSGLKSRLANEVEGGDLEKYPEQLNNQSWYRETEAGKRKSKEVVLVD